MTELIDFANASALSETASTSTTAKRSNREKFDSGLGEEIIEASSDHSSEKSDSDNYMEMESNDSTDEMDEDERGSKRGSEDEAPSTKWRKVTYSQNRCVSGSSTENESKSARDDIKVIPSPYSVHMKRKIQELPLPSILKNYMNYYREF